LLSFGKVVSCHIFCFSDISLNISGIAGAAAIASGEIDTPNRERIGFNTVVCRMNWKRPSIPQKWIFINWPFRMESAYTANTAKNIIQKEEKNRYEITDCNRTLL